MTRKSAPVTSTAVSAGGSSDSRSTAWIAVTATSPVDAMAVARQPPWGSTGFRQGAPAPGTPSDDSRGEQHGGRVHARIEAGRPGVDQPGLGPGVTVKAPAGAVSPTRVTSVEAAFGAGDVQAQAVVAAAHDRDRVRHLADGGLGHDAAARRLAHQLHAVPARVALGVEGQRVLPGEEREDLRGLLARLQHLAHLQPAKDQARPLGMRHGRRARVAVERDEGGARRQDREQPTS